MNTLMIPQEYVQKLKLSLVKHEGYLNYPSPDNGSIKIGIGYNLTERGISDNWIQNQFTEDYLSHNESLFNHTKFYKNLNNTRKIVLIELAFMGYKIFIIEFKEMFNDLDDKDYDGAAQKILESSWATNQMDRAIRLSESMRTGVYYI